MRLGIDSKRTELVCFNIYIYIFFTFHVTVICCFICLFSLVLDIRYYMLFSQIQSLILEDNGFNSGRQFVVP